MYNIDNATPLRFTKEDLYNAKSVIFYQCVYCSFNISSFLAEFKSAKKVYFLNCDKNFVYRCITSELFPVMDTLFLGSHPCQGIVFRQLEKRSNVKVFLDSRYEEYKERWAASSDNITIMTYRNMLEHVFSRSKRWYRSRVTNKLYRRPVELLIEN